jgi:hypothetical protein
VTGKIVPLVIYRDGERVVIGEAMINADRTVSCTITDAGVAEDLDVGASMLGSIHLNYDREHPSRVKFQVCVACSLDLCRGVFDLDEECNCCQRQHKAA